jgi:hypothetical protein
VSQEFQLVTRERPGARAFLRAVRAAAGSVAGDESGLDVLMDGDFGNPNGYLSIAGYGLMIEVEPPGHVEAADLGQQGGGEAGEAALPEPDEQGCLWLTIARIPGVAPEGSADVIWNAFQELASRYDGVVSPA